MGAARSLFPVSVYVLLQTFMTHASQSFWRNAQVCQILSIYQTVPSQTEGVHNNVHRNVEIRKSICIYKDQYAVENMLNMCGPKHVVKVCGYFACSGHPKHVKIILNIKKNPLNKTLGGGSMYKYLCTVHKTFIIAALHFQNFSSDEYCKNI